MADSTKNWSQWKKDFLHGRTHTAYGLIASSLASFYIAVISSVLDIRIASAISLVGSVGGLVDTVAHLYYH